MWQLNFFKENIRGIYSVYTLIIYAWESLLSQKQKLGDYYEYCRRSIIFEGGLNEERIRYIKEIKPLFYCVNQIPDQKSKELLHELIKYVDSSNCQ